MSNFILIGSLQTTSKEARAKVIEELAIVAKYTHEYEPDTYQYAITIPLDESDETSICVIEEYANQAAFEHHQTSSAFKDLIEWVEKEDAYANDPTIYIFNPMFAFTKPEVIKAKDPYIVFGTVSYHAGKMEESLPYWKEVFSTSQKNEAGTLGYALCMDSEEADVMRTVEVYESKDYLWSVHAKSNEVGENVKNTAHLRTGLKHVFLKIVAGYFYKSRS